MENIDINIVKGPGSMSKTRLRDLPFDEWFVMSCEDDPWFYKRVTDKHYLVIEGNTITTRDCSDQASFVNPVVSMNIKVDLGFSV